ncbi:hypothetical protein EDB89DRAFT_1989243, partial [Lactarius sanguifluus]
MVVLRLRWPRHTPRTVAHLVHFTLVPLLVPDTVQFEAVLCRNFTVVPGARVIMHHVMCDHLPFRIHVPVAYHAKRSCHFYTDARSLQKRLLC